MFHKKMPLLLVLFGLLLVGCGEAKIDASSDESMKDSIEKVKASLPDNKKEEFENALKVVTFSSIDLSAIFQQSQMATGALDRKFKESLHGKSGMELIAMAEEVRSKKATEQAARELEQKAKVTQILVVAEEFRKQDDYEQALSRYQEASIYDSGNLDLVKKIAETERLLKEKLEQEAKKRTEVRDLLSEAQEFSRDEKLTQALAAYQQALKLDGDSKEAANGIKQTSQKVNDFKAANTYLPSVKLYAFEASTIDTYSKKEIPAVRFKLKNKGDRTLTKVEVTVYLKDAKGNVIAEENFYPVNESSYSFGKSNKPLKPNYIWEIEKEKWFTIENAPSEWQVGNAEAKITNLELKKQ